MRRVRAYSVGGQQGGIRNECRVGSGGGEGGDPGAFDEDGGQAYKQTAMVKPVYALVGGDLFLQLDRLGEIVRSSPKDVQRIDVEGESSQLADVLDELRSFAMFSSAKLVIVRSADAFVTKFREQVEGYVAKPVEGSTLVLRMNSLPKNQRIYKLIEKTGEAIDCQPPKDVPGWILNRAKTVHKLKLGPEAARVLFELVGDDLGRLDNELAKLALQTEGKDAVDPDAVAKTVSFQREQEMWDMTNEVAAGNVTEAVRRWRQLVQMDPSSEFRAVTWLVMWLEKVRKALAMKKEGKPEGVIAKELKIWPFDQQRPFFQTVGKLGEAGAGRLVDLLAEVDRRSKSGLGEMEQNVERFLLSVGTPAGR